MTAPIPEPRPEEEQPAGPQPAGPGPDGLPAGPGYAAPGAALAGAGAPGPDPRGQDGEPAGRVARRAGGRRGAGGPAAGGAGGAGAQGTGPAGGGRALAGGGIDLDRAEAIANATSVLSEEQAREVEAQILPQAGSMTRARLREKLGLAVLAADPEGAERRREQAERHADVRLYADDDHTATITASKLAQIEAAAGIARITAMPRARKAAGLPRSLGFP